MPPRHCGLKISPVTTLRATRSLRSLRHALRLTSPAKFSPFGHRPPFKGAGSCTSAELSSCMGCGLHFRYLRFSYAGATPHRSTCLFLHARGSFASPLCGSLMIDVQSHTGADPHTIKIFPRRQDGSEEKKFHRDLFSHIKKARKSRTFFSFSAPVRRDGISALPAEPERN